MYRKGNDKNHLLSNAGKSWLITVAMLSSLGSSAMAPVAGYAATAVTTKDQRVEDSALTNQSVETTTGETESSTSSTSESTMTESSSSEEAPGEVASDENTGEDSPEEATPVSEADDTTTAQETAQRKATRDSEPIDQWMPNKKLQEAVLYQLQHLEIKPSDAPTWHTVADIIPADMKYLKALYVGSPGGLPGASTYNADGSPYSIQGLEKAVNLTALFLGGGGMNQPPFQFFGNLVDISPLRNLTQLESVHLQHNQIEDISPLANLDNVSWLDLSFNHIADFSSLKGKTYMYHGQENSEFRYQYLVRSTPILVDAKTRKAHINSGVRLQDGSYPKNPKVANVKYWVSLQDGDLGQPISKMYYAGGGVTESENGGLDFYGIKDQEPGVTGDGLIPLQDKYFLNATYVDNDYTFVVVQPYRLGDVAAPVTVQYHDEDGQPIAPDATLTGEVGEKYEASPVEVEGYELDKQPDNATGTYGLDPITVTFTYRKKTPVPVQSTVEVHYQDESGRTLAPTMTLSGDVGQPYVTKPIEISGYVLKKTPDNATGVYGTTPVSVIYVYTKTSEGGDGGGTTPPTTEPPVNPVDPGEPGEPTDPDGTPDPGETGETPNPVDPEPTPTPGGVGDSINNGGSSTSVSDTNSEEHPTFGLPQTNEQRTVAALVGSILLIGSLLGWWIRRRH